MGPIADFCRFLKNGWNRSFFWLLLLESLALAIFLSDGIDAPRPFVLPVLSISCGLILLGGAHGLAVCLVSRTQQDVPSLASGIAFAGSPLLLLSLVIIRHYVFLNEFRPSLIIVVLLGTAFLQTLFMFRLKKRYPRAIRIGPPRSGYFWDRLSNKKLSLFVFLLPFVVYGLWASGVIFPPPPLTGDEPHYLIITKSLLADGDLDLSNNYQNGDYLAFYPGRLDAHSRPGKGGGQYARHTPGLPLLLAPAYFLGEKAAALGSRLGGSPSFSVRTLVFLVRAEICLLASLLGLAFFRLMLDYLKNRRLALLAWAVFCFTGPMVFYSQLVYPEIPAAVILLTIFAAFVQKRTDRSPAFFLAGLGIAGLPWLGVKYVPLAGAILLAVLITSFPVWRRQLSKILIFLAPPVISGFGFLAYYWITYGSLLPMSPYRGTSSSGPGFRAQLFHFRIVEFFRCGLGYLLDQRVGVIPYAPVYLIAVAGLVRIFKKDKGEASWALAIFTLYWVFCSSAYYWGGYCPPGRTLLPVLWIMGFFMAAALASPDTGTSFSIRNTLILLSLAIAIAAMLNPGLLYHENLSFGRSERGLNSQLLTELSNSFVNLKNTVPDLINQERLLSAPLLFWLAVTGLVTFILIRKRRAELRPASGLRMRSPAIAVVCVGLLCLLYVFFDARLEGGYAFEDGGFSLLAQDQNSFPPELGGFWTKGKSQATLFLRSQNRVRTMALVLRSPALTRANIQVGKDRKVISWNKDRGEAKSAVFLSPVGFPWRGNQLYFIRIQAADGFFPFREEKGSPDRRFLGAFVTIGAEALTSRTLFDILSGLSAKVL